MNPAKLDDSNNQTPLLVQRRVTSLSLSLAITLLAFFLSFHLSPYRYLLYRHSETTNTTIPLIDLPSSPEYLFYKKNSALAKDITKRSWDQPYILTSFARPYHNNESLTELAVFTTGVTMGNFNRNFTAAACLIDSNMYPVVRSEVDVFYCHMPTRVEKGQSVTLVLHMDERLRKAMTGPVILNFDLNTTLDQSRISALPKKIVSHLPSTNPHSEYRAISTTYKFNVSPAENVRKLADYESKPRYENCIIAPVKHTSHLLPSWIDYHRRLGYDHVYVLDNDDPNDLKKVFSNRPDVDVLYWPWSKTQPQHLTYSLLWARNYCTTLHICDSDEYLLLGMGEKNELAGKRPLSSWMRRRVKDGKQVAFFPYLMMNNSMNVRQPSAPPPEAYIHISTEKSKNGKAMVVLDFPWTVSVVHTARGWERAYSYTKESSLFPTDPDARPIQVHFRHRSYEEMERKKNIGSGSMLNNLGSTREWEEPDFENPPPQYLESDVNMKYTFFRDAWREVTAKGSISDMTIVRTVSGKQSMFAYNWADRSLRMTYPTSPDHLHS